MKTFWLYYGAAPVYCVRAPAAATDQAIRAEALRQHGLVPCCFADYPAMNPGEFADVLRTATVARD